MCGRVFVKSSVAELIATFPHVRRDRNDDLDEMPVRFNGAPGQDYALIVVEPDTPGAMFTLARWGFTPRWAKDRNSGPRPINAKSETVASKPMFRAAYRARRALLPVDGFFEWQAVKDERAKQPFAIAMKDGAPFCLAAIWESWRDPEIGVEDMTFAVLTCPANSFVGEIHDRMPVIIAPDDYRRWLGEEEDPGDLLRPYPAEKMTMWPISRRVNSPANNDPSILDLFEDD